MLYSPLAKCQIYSGFMRDYSEITSRVENLRSLDTSVRVLAEVEGYPILGVTYGAGPSLPTALVTGGTHGDEPAGVEAVLRFLEREPGAWLGRLCIETIVCINPYGWVHDTRRGP